MSDEMVTLATFANTFEAEMVKNRLADEGIPAFVIGEMSGTLFSGMSNLFGEVRLLVAESNLERAAAIVEGEPEDEPADDPASEPTASIKAPDWSREPSRQAKSSAETSIQAPSGVRKPGDADAAADLRAAAMPPAGSDDDDDDEDSLRIEWGPDDYAARAWKAAVAGLVIPLLLLYSAWCLVRLFSMDGELSPAGTRKLYGALIINGLALMFVFLLCWGVRELAFR